MKLLLRTDRSGLIFNVSGHVGRGCGNSIEDVLLVQFLMRKAAERKLQNKPALRERILRVPLTGVCDELTIDGILASQEHMRSKFPGTVVDGKVSPARASAYGDGVWTIVSLNVTVRDSFPDRWPRLQDFNDCPLMLTLKIPAIL